MTEQLEGPELWLRVAQVMGLEAHIENGTVWIKVDYYLKNHAQIFGEEFDPPNNGAHRDAMHQFASERGDVIYERSPEDERQVTIYPYAEGPAIHPQTGPTDAIALGRAIVEAWG